MSKLSKWFVVATEGATTDGRKISRDWIEQMAAQYDPKNTYGARINLEHIKFDYYDADFAHSKCYGDVLAVKAEEREDGKLQLLAQIQPTDELIALNKAGQKLYTSVEIDLDFADTGAAYLVGLAVTDNPASLGTEMLSFSAQAKTNPFANRKIKADNLFSEAIESILEFEDIAEPKPHFSILEKIKGLFAKKEKQADERFADMEQAIELIGTHEAETAEKVTALSASLEVEKRKVDTLSATVAKWDEKFSQLAQQPNANYRERPLATGASTDQSSGFFY